MSEPQPIYERLKEFCRRLLARPAFGGFDEAWEGLAKEMTEVEDDLSGIAKQEGSGEAREDGRMYPPLMKREVASGAAGVRSFRVKWHLVSYGENGAVEIVNIDRTTHKPIFEKPVLKKPGADGRLVSDYRRKEQ